MPTDVVMPQMGESIFEGTITKWLKQPGDKVQRDEPLFEISTDKVEAEIPAPTSGTLQEIKIQAGATIQVDAVGSELSRQKAIAPARRQQPRSRGKTCHRFSGWKRQQRRQPPPRRSPRLRPRRVKA